MEKVFERGSNKKKERSKLRCRHRFASWFFEGGGEEKLTFFGAVSDALLPLN